MVQRRRLPVGKVVSNVDFQIFVERVLVVLFEHPGVGGQQLGPRGGLGLPSLGALDRLRKPLPRLRKQCLVLACPPLHLPNLVQQRRLGVPLLHRLDRPRHSVVLLLAQRRLGQPHKHPPEPRLPGHRRFRLPGQERLQAPLGFRHLLLHQLRLGPGEIGLQPVRSRRKSLDRQVGEALHFGPVGPLARHVLQLVDRPLGGPGLGLGIPGHLLELLPRRPQAIGQQFALGQDHPRIPRERTGGILGHQPGKQRVGSLEPLGLIMLRGPVVECPIGAGMLGEPLQQRGEAAIGPGGFVEVELQPARPPTRLEDVVRFARQGRRPGERLQRLGPPTLRQQRLPHHERSLGRQGVGGILGHQLLKRLRRLGVPLLPRPAPAQVSQRAWSPDRVFCQRHQVGVESLGVGEIVPGVCDFAHFQQRGLPLGSAGELAGQGLQRQVHLGLVARQCRGDRRERPRLAGERPSGLTFEVGGDVGPPQAAFPLDGLPLGVGGGLAGNGPRLLPGQFDVSGGPLQVEIDEIAPAWFPRHLFEQRSGRLQAGLVVGQFQQRLAPVVTSLLAGAVDLARLHHPLEDRDRLLEQGLGLVGPPVPFGPGPFDRQGPPPQNRLPLPEASFREFGLVPRRNRFGLGNLAGVQGTGLGRVQGLLPQLPHGPVGQQLLEPLLGRAKRTDPQQGVARLVEHLFGLGRRTNLGVGCQQPVGGRLPLSLLFQGQPHPQAAIGRCLDRGRRLPQGRLGLGKLLRLVQGVTLVEQRPRPLSTFRKLGQVLRELPRRLGILFLPKQQIPQRHPRVGGVFVPLHLGQLPVRGNRRLGLTQCLLGLRPPELTVGRHGPLREFFQGPVERLQRRLGLRRGQLGLGQVRQCVLEVGVGGVRRDELRQFLPGSGVVAQLETAVTNPVPRLGNPLGLGMLLEERPEGVAGWAEFVQANVGQAQHKAGTLGLGVPGRFLQELRERVDRLPIPLPLVEADPQLVRLEFVGLLGLGGEDRGRPAQARQGRQQRQAQAQEHPRPPDVSGGTSQDLAPGGREGGHGVRAECLQEREQDGARWYPNCSSPHKHPTGSLPLRSRTQQTTWASWIK